MFKNREIGHVFSHISSHTTRMAKRTTPSDSAHQIGPSTLPKGVLTVDQGVCGWMFKNREIGHVFDHISISKACTSKRIFPSDSAHRIRVSTLSKGVLTVDEALCGWMFKNRGIEHVFGHISAGQARTSKRTTSSDSPHQIGPSTCFKDVLTVDKGVCGWMFKNREIGHVFGHISISKARTSKRISLSDSTHRICVSTISKGVRRVDEALCGWMFRKSRYRTRFWPYLHNQGPYVQTDNTIGFSASNRCLYPLEGRTDCI